MYHQLTSSVDLSAVKGGRHGITSCQVMLQQMMLYTDDHEDLLEYIEAGDELLKEYDIRESYQVQLHVVMAQSMILSLQPCEEITLASLAVMVSQWCSAGVSHASFTDLLFLVIIPKLFRHLQIMQPTQTRIDFYTTTADMIGLLHSVDPLSALVQHINANAPAFSAILTACCPFDIPDSLLHRYTAFINVLIRFAAPFASNARIAQIQVLMREPMIALTAQDYCNGYEALIAMARDWQLDTELPQSISAMLSDVLN